MNLVCDHVVLEQILCPIDILPPIIMDDTMVGAESSPEFLGENNGKKPDCEVIGEPRYVTMPGSCYKKPPPFCPIVVDDAPPTAAVEDEDDGEAFVAPVPDLAFGDEDKGSLAVVEPLHLPIAAPYIEAIH